MSALADWLQTITVYEDMPDLAAEVACFCRNCDHAATSVIVWDCTGCGRRSRTYCALHTGVFAALAANSILKHGPSECLAEGAIVIRCVVPL